jgi:hypothetical protein
MTALSLISNWDRIARVCMCPSICNKPAVICLTIGKQNELGGNRAYSRKESDKILVTALSCRLIKNHVGSQFSQESWDLNLEQPFPCSMLCVPCLGEQLP